MRILIVEDEAPIAEDILCTIKNILGNKLSSIHIETTLSNAGLYLSEKAIDVLVLDLNLHGKNGFELLKDYVARSFHTIIVSANIDKALEAFEYGVLDFIPKPYTEERIRKAFDRLNDPFALEGYAIRNISVRQNGKIKIIPLAQVKYFKGANVYSEIYLHNGQMELYDKTLNNLSMLLPKNYIRIHKSFIVDSKLIKSIIMHGSGRYDVELTTGDNLPLSRERYKEIKNIFS